MSEQNPTKPADVLPDTPEEQPDRVTIIDAYALADPPRDAWENFGDANPEHHGGLWVTYNGSRWSVYETVPATELIDREEIEAHESKGHHVQGKLRPERLLSNDPWTLENEVGDE